MLDDYKKWMHTVTEQWAHMWCVMPNGKLVNIK